MNRTGMAGRAVAIAVLVEGGASSALRRPPLGRKILELLGYRLYWQ